MDIGIQVSPNLMNTGVQSERLKQKSIETMTLNPSSIDHGIQTVLFKKDSTASNETVSKINLEHTLKVNQLKSRYANK
jgi:hypothetical protein